jgi:hypothetical protein
LVKHFKLKPAKDTLELLAHNQAYDKSKPFVWTGYNICEACAYFAALLCLFSLPLFSLRFRSVLQSFLTLPPQHLHTHITPSLTSAPFSSPRHCAGAQKRGYFAAKSGRLDVYRAAHEMCRNAQHGQILLSLQPPAELPSLPSSPQAMGSAEAEEDATLARTLHQLLFQGGGDDGAGAGAGDEGADADAVDEAIEALLDDFEMNDNTVSTGPPTPTWLIRALQGVLAEDPPVDPAGELFQWTTFPTESYDYDSVLCMLSELETVLEGVMTYADVRCSPPPPLTRTLNNQLPLVLPSSQHMCDPKTCHSHR